MMQPFEEYIKSNILKFRELYKKINVELRDFIEKKQNLYGTRLTEPCQVVALSYPDVSDVFLLIANSNKHPDLFITVKQDIPFENFWDEAELDDTLIELFGEVELKMIKAQVKPFPFSAVKGEPLVSAFWNDITLILHLGEDPRSNKDLIANNFINHLEYEIKNFERKEQSEKIENTVDILKRDIEAIPENIELKRQIIKTTENLNEEINELHKRVDDEVSAFRELVGKSEKLLDWKIFSGDVEFLKKTHVNKETFNIEIKRLDEKLEKGFEALNTRIEDLKAIKFWSKRTVLEILLAIWGAIVSLYAAGILKL